MKRDVASKDLKNRIRSSTDDTKNLKREISDLKNDISFKEKKLLESSVEIRRKNISRMKKNDLNKLGMNFCQAQPSSI